MATGGFVRSASAQTTLAIGPPDSAFQGIPTVISGSAQIVQTLNLDTITVNTAQTVINFTTFDTAIGGGPITFLPSGRTGIFQADPKSGLTNFTVLNRIIPNDATRAIRFDGTVQSQIANAAGGFDVAGNVWFYSPGGIIASSSSIFDVGSLVLTAADIDTTGGLFGADGQIRFRGAPGSLSSVQVDAGAKINAVGAGSYVALVAPRIVQSGTVNSDGSVGYIAGEQVDVTIHDNLFDINFLQGSTGGAGAVNHDGTTSFGAGTGAGPQRVYVAALAKNDAITILVSGSIGYAAANQASVENGKVVLLANRNIVDSVNGETITNVDSAPLADIRIGADTTGSTIFNAAVLADGQNDVLVAPQGGSVVRFRGNTRLISDHATAILASGNSEVRARGDLNLLSRALRTGSVASVIASGGSTSETRPGIIDVGGNLAVDGGGTATARAELIADAGEISILGNATISAAARNGGGFSSEHGGSATVRVGDVGSLLSTNSLLIDAGAGSGADATGGSANLFVEGGMLTANGTVLDASANAGAGNNGLGGNATTTVTGGELRSLGLSLDVSGRSALSNAGFSARGAANRVPNGSIVGGSALITVSGGTTTIDGDVNLIANADARVSDVATGDVLAGSARIILNGGNLTAGDALGLFADGFGGSSFSQNVAPITRGGLASASVANGTLLTSAAELSADAIGVNRATTGGEAVAGSALLTLNSGGTARADGGFKLRAAAIGGNGATGGDATGGAALVTTNGGNLTTGIVSLVANAAGGVGGDGNGEALAGAGGIAVGGTARAALATGNASVDEFRVSANATGGRGGSDFAAGAAGGNAEGGIADVSIGAANVLTTGFVLDGSATGGSGGSGDGGGNGGSATGGTARLISEAASQIRFNQINQVAFQSTFDARAFGGAGGASTGAAQAGAGGSATGGNARLQLTGATYELPASPFAISADVFASASGGAGGAGGDNSGYGATGSGGAGGTALGGSARADLSNNIVALGAINIAADGTGGNGGDANSGYGASGNGGTGGNATGGTTSVDISNSIANSGTIAMLTLFANANAGNGGSGSIQGAGGSASGQGNARISANAGQQAITDVALTATSIGGNGSTGGAATGGTVLVTAIDGATANTTSVVLNANANAGFGPSGSLGIGGVIDVSASGGLLTASTLTASADGHGFSGALPGNDTAGGAGGAIAITAKKNSAGAFGALSLGQASLSASGFSTLQNEGPSPNAVAGLIRIANLNASINAPALQFTTLSATANGVSAVGFNSARGISFVANNSNINISGAASLTSDEDITVAATGTGTVITGGTFDATARNQINISHASRSGAMATLRGGDINLIAGNMLTAGAGTIVQADNALGARSRFGSVDASDLRARASVFAFAGADLTIGSATTTGTSPSADIDLRAGYLENSNQGFDYVAATARIVSAVTATRDIFIRSGGDVSIDPAAELRANNQIIAASGDDILIGNGASLASGLAPNGGYGGGAMRGDLILNAGSIGAPSANVAALIIGSASLSARNSAITLGAEAIEGNAASLSGGSVSALANNAPAIGITGSNDGGQLSAGCVEGNICLGSVNANTNAAFSGATGAINIGPISGTAGLANAVSITGPVSGENVVVRARDAVTLGTAGQSSAITGRNSLFVAVTGGDVNLLGGSQLSGGAGGVKVYASGAINGANATLNASGDVGLFAGSAIAVKSIDSGGVLNTIDVDGGITRMGLLNVAGPLTVADTLTVRGGDARIITSGALSIATAQLGNANSLTLQSSAGNVSLNATSGALGGAQDVTLTGVNVTVGRITANRDIRVTATNDFMGGVNAGSNVALSAGRNANFSATAGQNIVTTAGSTATVASANAGNRLTINAAIVDATTLVAAEDIVLNASSSINVGSASAGDDIDAAALGLVTIASARTTGAFNSGYGSDPSNITLTSTANQAVVTNGQARDNLTLNAATGAVSTGTLIADRGAILINGGTRANISNATATLGSTTINASVVNAAIINAATDIVINFASVASLGNLSAGVDLTATGTGALSIVAATVGRDINLLTDGSTAIESAMAGRTLRNTSGSLAATALRAGSDIVIITSGNADLGNATAATMIGVQATNITGLSLIAGEDIRLIANGAINVASLTSGDDIDANAVNGITLGSARATANARDDRALQFVAPNFTTVTAPSDGSDIRLTSNGAITAGVLDAGDDIRISGGIITLTGAVTTRGLDNTGGASDLILSGQDIGVASVDAFSNIDVNGRTFNAASLLAGNAINVTTIGSQTLGTSRAILGEISATAGTNGNIRFGLLTSGAATTLTSGNGITGGSVNAGTDLLLAGNGGAVSFANLQSGGKTTVTTDSAITGTNVSAGGSAVLNAASINASQINSNFGSVSASARNVTVGTLMSGLDIIIDTAALTNSSIMIGTATAARDVSLLGGTNGITATSLIAGDDVAVIGSGNVSIASARADGSFDAGYGGAPDPSNITVSAVSGRVLLTTGRARDNVTITTPSGVTSESLIADRGAIQVNGGTLANINTATATLGSVTINADAVTTAMVNAATDATFGFGTSATLGTVTAGNAIAAIGTGNVAFTRFTSGGMTTIMAGGSVIGGDASAGSALRIMAGTLADVDTLGSARDGVFVGARNVDLGAIVAAVDIVVNNKGLSRGNILIGTANAGRDVSISGGANGITATSVTAGDDVDVMALGNVTIGSATARGIANGGYGQASDPANLTVTASSGNIAIGTGSARNNVTVSASGTLLATGPISAGAAAGLDGGSVTTANVTAGTGVVLRSASTLATGSIVTTAGAINATSATGAIIASARAGGDIILTNGTGPLSADALTALGNVTATSGGALDVGTSTSGGATMLSGATVNAQTLTAGSDLSVAATGAATIGTARSTGGNATISGGGAVSTTTIGALGDVRIASSGGDVTLGGATNAGRNLTVTARNLATVNNVANGQAITLSSADIAVNIAAGQIGEQGRTASVLITNSGTGLTTIGGSGGSGGFRLDNAEAQRIFAGDIIITAGAVSGVQQSAALTTRAPDVILDTLSLTGATGQTGATAGNIGASGRLRIETTGKLRTIGTVTVANLTSANRFQINAAQGIEVDAATGSISLSGTGTTPLGGTLELTAPSVVAASLTAITDVIATSDIKAASDRLARNDNAISDPGSLRANAIIVNVSSGFFVQNSGIREITPFNLSDRRGLTVGTGGLQINASSATARIIISGRQMTASGSFITGLDFLRLTSINGAQLSLGGVAPAGFDTGSTINGCAVLNPASCIAIVATVATIATDTIARDVINNANDDRRRPGNSTDGNFLRFQLKNLEETTNDPVVDDPVTGVGNDDFWAVYDAKECADDQSLEACPKTETPKQK